MDFTNFTTVPEWVQVLTKAKLPGHDNQSTQGSLWDQREPKGKLATLPSGLLLLRCRLLLLWPSHTHTHTCRQRECVQCVDCKCHVCVLRVAMGLTSVVAYV
jgi:hypothetical protein